MLASSSGDTQDKLLKLLGLDSATDIDAILAAVKKAFDASDSPDGTPPDDAGAAETADPTDPTRTGARPVPQTSMHVGATQSGRGTRQLSESDREGIRRFGSASAWAAAKRAAVRRA